ncbi:MAG TPA: hypothetical protein VMS78_15600 [Rhizomicrobium sp.]|nr:hypothetical protein [Rhizomicrobium sp.]
MLLNPDRKIVVSPFGQLLSLAALPAFAAMAVWQGFYGSTTICSAMGPEVLNGMAPMYGLMAVFHLPPWIALTSGRRGSVPV